MTKGGEMFTSKAQADAYTRTFNELLDWTEKAIERIADMAASAYEERIWEMYEDCNSWESYVRVHLHTNRIKLTVPERRAVVVKLYHERGMTQQQTADVLGVSQSTVRDDLRTEGISRTTNVGRPRAELDAEIVNDLYLPNDRPTSTNPHAMSRIAITARFAKINDLMQPLLKQDEPLDGGVDADIFFSMADQLARMTGRETWAHAQGSAAVPRSQNPESDAADLGNTAQTSARG